MGLLDGVTGTSYYSGSDHGNYQFTSLQDIINQFMIMYVGDNKIINKVKRPEVALHAQRGLQELSFDTFKSTKALEIDVPATLQMILPQDYVNYVKVTKSDSKGIEHILYPAIKTSNPQKIAQTSDTSITNNYDFGGGTEIQTSDSDTWTNYQTSSNNQNTDYFSALDFDDDHVLYQVEGRRYGLDPQHAQINGSFYIDEIRGKIHFSSNISGQNIILHYISDGLGTDAEMQVHKFAEEAMYKYIAYAILSSHSNMSQAVVARFKKEARAAKRQAKLRLSNIKLEEITQIFRGKSKHIKH